MLARFAGSQPATRVGRLKTELIAHSTRKVDERGCLPSFSDVTGPSHRLREATAAALLGRRVLALVRPRGHHELKLNRSPQCWPRASSVTLHSFSIDPVLVVAEVQPVHR